jgi:hypothetical protein
MNDQERFAPIAVLLRKRARKIVEREDLSDHEKDNAELINVLARLLEGKTPYQAFGAPGDWGYETVIGDALAEAYRK